MPMMTLRLARYPSKSLSQDGFSHVASAIRRSQDGEGQQRKLFCCEDECQACNWMCGEGVQARAAI